MGTVAPSRVVVGLLVLAAVALSGWTFADRAREGRLGERPDTLAAARLDSAYELLDVAAERLAEVHDLTGTYGHAGMFDDRGGLQLIEASESGYCLEVRREGVLVSLRGPGGRVEHRSCSS